jgi:hypothetical protein
MVKERQVELGYYILTLNTYVLVYQPQTIFLKQLKCDFLKMAN